MNSSTLRQMGVPEPSRKSHVIASPAPKRETQYAQRMGHVNDHAGERRPAPPTVAVGAGNLADGSATTRTATI